MKNRLFIQLPDDPQSALLWGEWNSDEQQWNEQGEVLAADLISLADKSAKCETLVIVPSSKVSRKLITTPAKQLKQIQRAVPYMLEDQLASPVDQLHFAYGKRSKSGEVDVLWTTHQQMEQWLEWFEQAEIHIDIMLSENDLLKPATDATEIILNQNFALVNQIDGKRWSCQRDLLPMLWQASTESDDSNATDKKQAGKKDTGKKEIGNKDTANKGDSSSDVKNSLEPTLDGSDEHQSADDFDMLRIFHVGELESYWQDNQNVIAQPLTEFELLNIFAQNVHKQSINLLQQQYAPKKESNLQWIKYRSLAKVAGFSFLIFLVYQGSQYYVLEQERKVLRQQAEQNFQKVFARRPRGGSILGQAERLLSRGGGEAEQGEFLKLLNATSAKIVSLDKVKPTSITFDGRKSELRVDVLAPDYQTLNNFKSSLTEAGLMVDMSSASSQGDAYSTRLIIRSGS